jgi:V8-like Glu-specific endopeptidase
MIKTLVRASGILVVAVLLAYASLAQEGREIARNSFPSVVLIVAENGKAHRKSLGSGFFVRDDLIVTNYHVIKGYSRIRVKLVGHKDIYQAQVVSASSAKDLAFLGVVGVQATPLSFGHVQEVAIGDQVYAIGNPEGLEATLSQGIISGIRQIGGNRYFQISAPISHGSSGGPVLNKSGEVIGVAVAALRTGQNLNFAIPISDVAALMSHTAGDTGWDFSGADRLIEPAKQPERKLALSPYAKEQLTKAIDRVRKQPNSADTHFMLAETYRENTLYEGVRLEDAIREYRRVIQLEPKHAKAHLRLAESYMEASLEGGHIKGPSVEAAITYYKQAIRIDPS